MDVFKCKESTAQFITLMITDVIHGDFETLGEVSTYDLELAPAKPYVKKLKIFKNDVAG